MKKELEKQAKPETDAELRQSVAAGVRQWGMSIRKFPSFWHNDDLKSQARKIRLAVVQNVFDQGHITEAEAKEILSGRLDPDDENSIVDDSGYLDTTTPTT